jgi:drug/metabolite transporter (DMT)-like permease
MSNEAPRESAPVQAATRSPLSAAGDLLNATAPLLFVLLWSSSFVGARIGLRHMSPLWFVALRLIFATGIMAAAIGCIARSLAYRRRRSC